MEGFLICDSSDVTGSSSHIKKFNTFYTNLTFIPKEILVFFDFFLYDVDMIGEFLLNDFNCSDMSPLITVHVEYAYLSCFNAEKRNGAETSEPMWTNNQQTIIVIIDKQWKFQPLDYSRVRDAAVRQTHPPTGPYILTGLSSSDITTQRSSRDVQNWELIEVIRT